MSRYTNLPKTKKKKPDEFITTIDRITKFALSYKKPFIALLIIIIVVSVGYFAIQQKQNRDLMVFNTALNKALQDDNKEQALKDVIAGFGSKDVSVAARLPLIQIYLEKKDYALAQQEASQASQHTVPYFASMLKLSDVELLWQEGKLDEALSEIEGLSAADRGIVGDYFTLVKAQILEAQGKKGEALRIYQTLTIEAVEDPYVQTKAKEYLLLLSANETTPE